MNVLITGAAGFIGAHLRNALEARGHTVVGVDNFSTGQNNAPRNVRMDIAAERGDFYALANRVGPELVVHCAASYSDPRLWHRDIETNIAGSVNAAAVAKHHGARLIYFQTALPPTSSYAISKIAGQRYLELSGVPLLVFRLANVYGPRNLSGPIPTFYRKLKAGETCTVVRDAARDLVYIDDLVRFVLSSLGQGTLGTVDVCSGELFSIARMYEAVRNAVGSDLEPELVSLQGDDVARMDFRGPAVSTMVPLEEGVKRACEWYDEHGVTETYTHLAAR